MQWKFTSGSPDKARFKAIVYGVFEDLDFSSLPLNAGPVKNAKQVRFKGKEGEAFFAFDLYGIPKKHLLVVGLGKRGDFGPPMLRKAAALAARRLRGRFITSAAFHFPLDQAAGKEALLYGRALVEGVLLGGERFAEFQSEDENHFEGLDKAAFIVSGEKAIFEEGGRTGAVLAEATLFARNLVTTPSNVLTPEKMAVEAKKIAKESGFTIKVLDAAACKKLGMGAYLAVASGSANAPRFIHISYRPRGAKFRLGLVGKGLTFDSGGISIKPSAGMGDMKDDMAGSAAVLGAMKAIGKLRPKVGVEAVMAMTENMPDGKAYHPGDIVTSMSGKTIEVKNTDAEGRLTLADALTYVQKQKVDAVMDLATLTGACVVALGPDFAGLMGNDQALLDEILDASRQSGDELWQLPLPAAYESYIKSSVADVSNIASIRWGGALTAGLFLKRFIDDNLPWAHIDIAGPALREKDGIDSNRGEGSGAGVRTIVNFLLNKAG